MVKKYGRTLVFYTKLRSVEHRRTPYYTLTRSELFKDTENEQILFTVNCRIELTRKLANPKLVRTTDPGEGEKETTEGKLHKDLCHVSFISLTRLALACVLGPFGTFAEIHSTHPGVLVHYSRLEFHFKV